MCPIWSLKFSVILIESGSCLSKHGVRGKVYFLKSPDPLANGQHCTEVYAVSFFCALFRKQIVRSKCETMPADNDHVESSAQISAPPASTPSTAQVQASPAIYLKII